MPATGWTPSGLTCTFGCHVYDRQVGVRSVFLYLGALIMDHINEKYLKMHATDLKRVQLSCHEQRFAAGKNGCVISLDAEEGLC